jgi:ribosomal protein S18 acetylase RimI-like enzyme
MVPWSTGQRTIMNDVQHEFGPTVRRATHADAADIAALINRAYAVVEKDFVDGERTSEEEVRKLQEQGYFLVIDRKGKGGGLAASVFVSMMRRRGYFALLAVAPDCQGSGLGRRLVAVVEALCEAEGCTALDLQVVNLRAELAPWYRSLGYRECGTAPFEEARVPCHFIRMTKALA